MEPEPSLQELRRLGVFVSYGELLASAGMIGVAFDHRFLSTEHLPSAASDVADLISHVRAHADPLGIDASRLALWAFSGVVSCWLSHYATGRSGASSSWPTTR